MDQPEPAAAQPTAEDAAQQEAATLKAQFLNGISWFYWIGALSLVNMAMSHFADRKFIIGLGITEVLDALAFADGKQVSVGWMAASVLVSVGFIGLGYLGRKGKRAFIIAGLAFYALDAALLIFAKDVLSVLFHAYAGWSIFRGFQALGKILTGLPATTVKPVST